MSTFSASIFAEAEAKFPYVSVDCMPVRTLLFRERTGTRLGQVCTLRGIEFGAAMVTGYG